MAVQLLIYKRFPLQDKILLEIHFFSIGKACLSERKNVINKELLDVSDSTLDVSNMKHIAFQGV